MSPGMPAVTTLHQDRRDGPLIGLIADSHGRAKTMAAALEYLKAERCTHLYHLGDICDSLHPETADACVELLQDYQVKSVKGNNDHSIVVNQASRKTPSIRPETLHYLEQLPLVIQTGRTIMAHSLPFEKELGLACMVGAMTHDYARVFFRSFGDCILFRGHSHSPDIAWQDCEGRIVSANISLEQTINITERLPCIVTCGALDQGLCLLWSLTDSSVTSLRF